MTTTFDLVAFACEIKKTALADARKSSTKRIKNIKKRIPLAAAFRELGLIEDYQVEGFIKYGRRVQITVEKLPVLKRAIMSCGYKGAEAVISDVGSYSLRSSILRTVDVCLECPALTDIDISVCYEKVLPADAKCRIVKQEYETLVCG